MKLRKWQANATETAVINYSKGRKLFVTEACTGAGKTRHGVETGIELMKSKSVDLVIVLTPSIATRSGWKDSFNKARTSLSEIRVTDDKDFPLDTNVWLTTYSGYENAKKALASAPVRLGVFTIVDEYHHAEQEAAWGLAVSELGGIAKHVLFLSGTPWKQSGFCPLLADEKNIHGDHYYKEGSNRVNPDFIHDYKHDLESGQDRATHWVKFDFLPSTFEHTKGARKGQIERFELPDYKNKTPEEKLAWQEEAKLNQSPLGRHVQVEDNRLTNSKTAKLVIEKGVQRLIKSRSEALRVCGQKDMTVMLLVCQNINAAKDCAAYISEVYQLRTEYIVSEDDRSHEKLEKIRQECAVNSPNKPDVIVSVGMISEGVDIPQIKVIAYLSAILTVLYLIQVIGRALRRMFVSSKKGFADNHASDIQAYFVAPAHPKICYIASKIEEQMEDVQSTRSEGGGDGEGKEKVEGVTDSSGDVETFLRGQADGADWHERIETLKQHERASECFLDDAWCAYVLGLALNGDEPSKQKAMDLAQDMCGCLGINYQEIWQHVSAKADHSLSYDQEQKLLRKQAQYLTNVIRWKCKPFCDDPENDKAYMTVRSALNRVAGFPRGLGFAKASLEQKYEWIKGAQKAVKEGEIR